MELPEIGRALRARSTSRTTASTLMPIELPHALRAGALPRLHGDPVRPDARGQAQIEGLPILTADPAISRYDVETIW